jgi:FlaA1/EpsC-like NDP-sugar epimerase
LLQIIVDAAIICAAFALAYTVRFEADIPSVYSKQFVFVLPYLVILRLAIFGGIGVYRLIWRFVTMRDLPRFALATGLGSLVLIAVRFLVAPVAGLAGLVVNPTHASVPFSVIAMELVLTSVGTVGARALWRLRTEEAKRKTGTGVPGKGRALLIGAGAAGVMVAREFKSNPNLGFEVAGFLDDAPEKRGKIVHGLRVLGKTADLPAIAAKQKAGTAIITIGDASADDVRRIVQLAEKAAVHVQTIPSLDEILSGRVAISKLRDVDIEDLLRRDPVSLDHDLIEEFVTGKTILVTGGGGSIGSEICRQVARFEPKCLYLLDQAETAAFHIHRELIAKFPDLEVIPLIANVSDRVRMRDVFLQSRPDVVFHAAAHKHVPLMEANPSEAISNNIGGSRVVADLAHEFVAEAFVMISTDKAVNPTSVMGVTKRVAELYVQALATRSDTRFVTVRFGNVLGSAGSVVPIFKEEISRGGPVHVTHPGMKRYFMSIPEASQLVLQSAAMGNGGEIFVLEMGEPISIVNLARDLITLSGFRPDHEIEIAFTGIRPGEKLSEEINLTEENATKTRHPRIWVGSSSAGDADEIVKDVERLLDSVGHLEPSALRKALEVAVPEYVAWRGDENVVRRAANFTRVRRLGPPAGPEATSPSSA